MPERFRAVAQTRAEQRAGGAGRQLPGTRQESGRTRPGFVSLSRGAVGAAAEQRPRPRPRQRAARAGSAVTGRASRRRAGTPPAPSLHYRTALRNRPGQGSTRPSAAGTPLPRSSLRRSALPPRHFSQALRGTAAARALGGAGGPWRRTHRPSAQARSCQPDGEMAVCVGTRG